MSTTQKTPVPAIRVLTPKETRQVSGGPMGSPTLGVPTDPKLGVQPA
jgi:hypothetical protein